MGMMNVMWLLITCLVVSIPSYVSGDNSESSTHKNALTWCVAQQNAPADKLQGFLDYVCGNAECAPIQPQGSCFEPNTLTAHGSYALHINYRITYQCNAEIGTITNRDPSYGRCVYLGLPDNGGH